MKRTRQSQGKYTREHIELLKDRTLSDLQVSLKIGRTIAAVRTKRGRMQAARKLVDALDLKRAAACVHEFKKDFLPGAGKTCQCIKCGFEPYQIGGAGSFILCNTCGGKSWSFGDVQHKYCSRCNVFHETGNKRTYPGQTK